MEFSGLVADREGNHYLYTHTRESPPLGGLMTF